MKQSWPRTMLTVTLLATPILTTQIHPATVQAATGSAPTIQWTKSVTQQGMIGQVTIGKNGEIYVVESNQNPANSHEVLHALNATGEKKWSVDFGFASIVGKITMDAEGNLHVITYEHGLDSHRFHVVSPNGTVKWSYHPGNKHFVIETVIGADGTVYVSENPGPLNAFTPSGEKKWSFAFPASDRPRKMLHAAEDGTLYAFSVNSLIAVNPDGTERWTFRGSDTDDYLAEAVVAYDGTVVVLGETTLTALNMDGSIKWTWKDEDRLPLHDIFLPNTAFIGQDGTVYYTPEQLSTIIALSPDGTKKWEANIGNKAQSGSYKIVAESHGLLYAMSTHSIVVLTQDGTPLWGKQLAFEENRVVGDPLVGVDGMMYFSSVGDFPSFSNLALSPTGSVKWSMGQNQVFMSGVKAIAGDGTMFASMGGKLFAIQGASVAVVLNGNLQEFDQPPVIRNERTLVPMRTIFEALDCDVARDQVTQTVTAIKGDTRIELQIGANFAKINGVERPLEASAQLINGRTLVPVRFISEALGASVTWEQKTRTIRIDS